MCFVIHSKHPDKKIAEKDIVCYKVLNKLSFESPFYHKKYKLNKLYKVKLGKSTLCKIINEGLYSYSNKKEICWFLRNKDYYCLIRSIIPKGSIYYYNPSRHEYISNQIILQEIIK